MAPSRSAASTMRSSTLPILFALAVPAAAQPPGYYASVDTRNATVLRQTLHAVIDDHVRFPYTAGTTDTWDILENAQQDPANSSRIVDVYRNGSHPKQGGGNSFYEREHSWPKSFGFPNDGPDNYPYTDCHQLFLCDPGFNSDRSNKPFDDCSAACEEKPTLLTNGRGGGSGSFPGNSNWTTGSFDTGTWQVWRHRKGDIARAMFYMDVRYEGGNHGQTGFAEPDLILTSNRSLIRTSTSNQSVAYMGVLSTLLRWHLEDPVDADEIRRNDIVYQYQRNRNPFVDHPEWAAILWDAPWPGAFTSFGAGCQGSHGGTPQLGMVAPPLIGQNAVFTVASAPPNAPAALHIDTFQWNIDLVIIGSPTCTLYALPTYSFPASTGATGAALRIVPIPDMPSLIAKSLYAQWVVIDAAAAKVTVSQGGTITFGNP
jgi:endonuclease I